MAKIKNEADKREITVSVDRLKLTIERYRSKKSMIAELAGYLSSILTLLITVCTAQYSDFWFLSAKALEGVFITLLTLIILIFIIRLMYMLAVRKGITNESKFIDSLEYREEVKTSADHQRKATIIIHTILVIGVLIIIGAYIGFGYLAKWHLAYNIIVSLIMFSIIITYISTWGEMFESIYNTFVKEEQ